MIESGMGGNRYTTTDLDSWLSTSRADVCGENGMICVSAKRLSECLASCKNAVDLEIVSMGKTSVGTGANGEKSEIEVFNLAVRNGSTFSLPTLPAEEFPPVPKIEKTEASFVIYSESLVHGLKRVAFAMSTDESRYVLNGILFEIENRGSKEIPSHGLNLIATDGRRLAWHEENSIQQTAVEFGPKEIRKGFIVPSRAVDMLLKLLAREKTDVSISFVLCGNTKVPQVQFSFTRNDGAAVNYISKQVDGNYPNYMQVIPRADDTKFSVTFDRAQFAAATATCEKSATEKQNSCNLEFTPGNCHLWNKSEIGESSVNLAVSEIVTKKPVARIAFNPRYLAECAAAISDRETFTMDFEDELSPGVIHFPFFKYVIMPMRFDAAKTPSKTAAPKPTAPETTAAITPQVTPQVSPTTAPEPAAVEIAPVPAPEIAPEPIAPKPFIHWAAADSIPARETFTVALIGGLTGYSILEQEGKTCHGELDHIPQGATVAKISGTWDSANRVLCRFHSEGKYWYTWTYRENLKKVYKPRAPKPAAPVVETPAAVPLSSIPGVQVVSNGNGESTVIVQPIVNTSLGITAEPETPQSAIPQWEPSEGMGEN